MQIRVPIRIHSLYPSFLYFSYYEIREETIDK